MKKVSLFKKMMTIVIALCVSTSLAFADGETTEVFLKGTTNSPAGDYVVQTTSDVFHFQGREYEVFNVYYDDSDMNMKIAVNTDGKCTSFVAYNGEFMFFYNCNRHGFGVRKVMFSNPWTCKSFCCEKFHNQTVLKKQKKIDKKEAVGMIATYVPQLKA